MLTHLKKLEAATMRGLSLEDYEEFLEAASAKVWENMEKYPDAKIPIDEDVFRHMGLDMMFEEVTEEEMAEMEDDLSCLDAELHEQEED